jgi:tetratricopeptide (TPR) repeat protein
MFILVYSFSLDIAAGEPPGPSVAAHRALYEAQQAMELKDNIKAAEILRTFIRENPKKNHYLLEFHLANALALLGKSKEALIHYEKTLALNPGLSAAWQNLGKTHLDLGNHLDAGNAFLKSYETGETKDGSILYYAAVSYLMGKKADKALPHLETLASGKAGDPRSEWLEALLKAYLDLKQEDKAFKLIHRLLDEQGANPRWWKFLAQLHLQKGEYLHAAEALTIHSYLTTPKEQEIVLLGDLYHVIGIPVKAVEYYEKAIQIENNPAVYEKLASAYISAHKPTKAENALEQALKKEPTAKLWSLLGKAYYEGELYEDAFKAFSQSVRLDPENGEYPLMMGYCALQLKNKDRAMMALQNASQFPGQRKIAKELLKQVASWKER